MRAVTPEKIAQLRDAVRDVPDFPIPGILFKDITPILADAGLFRDSIDLFAEACPEGVEKVVGIDARGFLFGSAVAYKLGLGFVAGAEEGEAAVQDRLGRV